MNKNDKVYQLFGLGSSLISLLAGGIGFIYLIRTEQYATSTDMFIGSMLAKKRKFHVSQSLLFLNHILKKKRLLEDMLLQTFMSMVQSILAFI